jgi:acetyl/propionyl-CoA carboxylase alpha subunit
VSIYYDPMLGKLIVSGRDREQALRRLGRALDELRVEGIHTTVPLYRALLADADFLAGRLDIEMLDRKLEAGELRPVAAAADNGDLPIAAIAAALEHFSNATMRTGVAGTDDNGAGPRRGGWREQGRREALRSGTWNW